MKPTPSIPPTPSPLDLARMMLPGLSLKDLDVPDRSVVALYSSNAGQSILTSGSTSYVVNFEDKEVDTHNAVTIGSGWKFTAPYSRNYIVAACIYYTSTTTWAAGEIMNLSVFRDASIYRTLWRRDDAATGGTAGIIGSGARMAVVPMRTGQYIDFRTLQNSGASLALHTGSNLVWCAILGIRGL